MYWFLNLRASWMKLAVSIALLSYSIRAAPAQDSASHSTRAANVHGDRLSTHAPNSHAIRPASQKPVLENDGSGSPSSRDLRSDLIQFWSAADCPATLPSTTCYRSHADFPPVSKWLSWECLIYQNIETLLDQNGHDEVFMMTASIKAASDAAGIDPRVPFALIMQATSGAVRPPLSNTTTALSHGLFQVQIPHAATCANTCFNRCPAETILAMIQDGIFGHHSPGFSTPPAAPGIGYWIPAEAGDVPRALRAYSSGAVLDRNDLTQTGRTGQASFVSDVANWLVGGSVGAVRPVTCL